MHFKNELLNELTCFCYIYELLQQCRQNHTVRLYLPQFSKLLYPCKAKLLMESAILLAYCLYFTATQLYRRVVYLPSRVYSKLLYPCKARFQWNQYISHSHCYLDTCLWTELFTYTSVVMLCTHSLFVSQCIHSASSRFLKEIF